MKFYRLSVVTFNDHISPYFNLLNLSWIKIVYFEEYGAFKWFYIIIAIREESDQTGRMCWMSNASHICHKINFYSEGLILNIWVKSMKIK